MKLRHAYHLASEIIKHMDGVVMRAQIAGSIRRQKPDVGDIEIVVIPKFTMRTVPADPNVLFSEDSQVRVNLLHERLSLKAWQKQIGLEWIMTNQSEPTPVEIKADGKHWKGYYPAIDVKVDIFITSPDHWGWTYLLRTGSKDFCQALVTHANRIGIPSEGGYFRDANGEPISTPTEQSVFNLLGLEWVEPSERTGWDAIRRLPS